MSETKIKIAIRLSTVKFALFYFKSILKESLKVVHSTHYMITNKKEYLSGIDIKSVKIPEISSIVNITFRAGLLVRRMNFSLHQVDTGIGVPVFIFSYNPNMKPLLK